jgi:hypothetical protein
MVTFENKAVPRVDSHIYTIICRLPTLNLTHTTLLMSIHTSSYSSAVVQILLYEAAAYLLLAVVSENQMTMLLRSP